jgi:hypothetical protein
MILVNLCAGNLRRRQAYDHRANIFKRVSVGMFAMFWIDEPVAILLGLSSTTIAMLLATATVAVIVSGIDKCVVHHVDGSARTRIWKTGSIKDKM